jgi:NitT/TauT family transport system substrate-binding protein
MRLRLYENHRFVLYAPFYAAHAIGADAAERLAIELLPSPDVGLAEQALLDGMVEVLWAGPMRVMKHHDENPNSALVCFAEVICRDPFSIVGQYPNPGFRLADLAKMRLATVSEVPTRGYACRRICSGRVSIRRGSIASPIAVWPKTSMP